MEEEEITLQDVLKELIAQSRGYVTVLLDQGGSVLASAGGRSPLGLAQHALTIAQGIFMMNSATGIESRPDTITDIDHGVDGRILLSIIQGYYILALLYNPAAPSAHAPFSEVALLLEESL